MGFELSKMREDIDSDIAERLFGSNNDNTNAIAAGSQDYYCTVTRQYYTDN